MQAKEETKKFQDRNSYTEMVGPTLVVRDAPLLLVVLVGVPGSGKSTFAASLIEGAPTVARRFQRISQDVLGSRGRCLKAATRALRNGEHVLVDRCNFDEQQRAHWLRLTAQNQIGGRGSGAGGEAAAEQRGPLGVANMPFSASKCDFDHRLAVCLPVAPDEALRRVLSRGAHEGGVDTAKMSKSKIASIVMRMQGDLRLPQTSEGFDEVLHVTPGDEQRRAEVLARIWALAEGVATQ